MMKTKKTLRKVRFRQLTGNNYNKKGFERDEINYPVQRITINK